MTPSPDEAQRQRELLAAVASGGVGTLVLRESGARAARGLEAYRANAESIAERALAAAFATVQAMLGAEDFARLAREFWHARPPEHGDLGEWGEALPQWIEAHIGTNCNIYLLRGFIFCVEGVNVFFALEHNRFSVC